MIKRIAALPLPILYFLADVLYLILYYGWGYRKKVVQSNLRIAFPEKSEKERKRLAKNFYRHLTQVIVEALKGYTISGEELLQRVRFKNPEVLREHLDDGKSIIVMASHQANWEWLILACGVYFDFPIDAVYKPLKNKRFDQFMYEARSRFGGNPIPMKNVLMEIMRRKKSARAYGLVADQTPGRSHEKYWTTFFNRDTPFFVGSQKIAEYTKYPVFFVRMHRLRRGYYEMDFVKIAEPPYEKGGQTVIENYAREAEQHIRSYPEQWLWSHRRWKHTKPAMAGLQD